MDNFPLFSDIGGRVNRVLRHPENDAAWSAFNPSIGYSESDGYLCTFRSSNYWYGKNLDKLEILSGNTVQNKTYVSRLGSDLSILNLQEIEYRGFDFSLPRGPEDAKLYYKNKRWELSAVIKEDHAVAVPRVATFYLEGSVANLIKLWPSPNSGATEKNWMTPYGEANFDFIYGPNKVYDGNIVTIVNKKRSRLTQNLRGGSNLYPLHDGTYLGICHTTRKKEATIYDPMSFGSRRVMLRDYTHSFVRCAPDGAIIQASEEFQFFGPGIEFAAGLVVVDGKVHVSFGYKDLSSYFGIIDLEKVMEALIDCYL